MQLEGGACRWSCCGTNPEVSPMCGMGVGIVGLKQLLTTELSERVTQQGLWYKTTPMSCELESSCGNVQ